jgi:hypothetical protein
LRSSLNNDEILKTIREKKEEWRKRKVVDFAWFGILPKARTIHLFA